MTEVLNVCITGAAGQVASYLIPLVADGEIFKDKKIHLRLLDIEEKIDYLKGLKMEIEDSCYDAIEDVIVTSKEEIAFKDCNRAILIGGKPRGKGMTRADLLRDNAKIFANQGKVINDVADKNVKVLVVANPSNTNCYIVSKNAPNIEDKNFSALSYLDLNRAYGLLSESLNVSVSDIKDVIIWGNHGETVVPDYEHVKINGKLLSKRYENFNIADENIKEYIKKRGSEIIKFKGRSSGFSAAKAIADHLRSFEIKSEKIFCAAVKSDGSYGVKKGIVFSYPGKSKGNGEYEIVNTLELSDRIKELISLSECELLEEINQVEN